MNSNKTSRWWMLHRCRHTNILNWIFREKKYGDVGDRTRGLSHAKRTLYHWATSPLWDWVMLKERREWSVEHSGLTSVTLTCISLSASIAQLYWSNISTLTLILTFHEYEIPFNAKSLQSQLWTLWMIQNLLKVGLLVLSPPRKAYWSMLTVIS